MITVEGLSSCERKSDTKMSNARHSRLFLGATVALGALAAGMATLPLAQAQTGQSDFVLETRTNIPNFVTGPSNIVPGRLFPNRPLTTADPAFGFGIDFTPFAGQNRLVSFTLGVGEDITAGSSSALLRIFRFDGSNPTGTALFSTIIDTRSTFRNDVGDTSFLLQADLSDQAFFLQPGQRYIALVDRTDGAAFSGSISNLGDYSHGGFGFARQQVAGGGFTGITRLPAFSGSSISFAQAEDIQLPVRFTFSGAPLCTTTAGDDECSVNAGADITFTEGGAGTDRFFFDGTNTITLDQRRLSSVLPDFEDYIVRGDWTFSGDRSNQNWSIDGGSLTLNNDLGLTNRVGGVTGGDGDDTLVSHMEHNGVIDLGAGNDRLEFFSNGSSGHQIRLGAGDDLLISRAEVVFFSGSSVRGAVFNGDIFAGEGNDYLDFRERGNNGVLRKVDAGAGDDIVLVRGYSVSGSLSGDRAALSLGDGDDWFEFGFRPDDPPYFAREKFLAQVTAGDGNDTAIIYSGVFEGGSLSNEVIDMGAGDDRLWVAGGLLGRQVGGSQQIRLGDGENRFALTGGDIRSTIRGGAGGDVFEITGGRVHRASGETTLLMGDGQNVFVGVGGRISQNIAGGSDSDTIILAGMTLDAGSSVSVGDGDDAFAFYAGEYSQSFSGGNGNDFFSSGVVASVSDLYQNFGLQPLRTILEGEQANLGGEGSGTGSGGGDGGGEFNEEECFLLENPEPCLGIGIEEPGFDQPDDPSAPTGSVLPPVVLTGALNGGAGDDFFSISAGTFASIDGGDGDDEIFLLGNIDYANPTTGLATLVTNDVLGGVGDDLIVLNGSVVFDTNGASVPSAGGVRVDGSLVGGEGDDRFDIIDGFADAIDAGDGDDVVVARGRGFARNITAGEGDDILDLAVSTSSPGVRQIERIDAGGGDDTVLLRGGNLINTQVLLGEGDDFFGMRFRRGAAAFGDQGGGDLKLTSGDYEFRFGSGVASLFSVSPGGGTDTFAFLVGDGGRLDLNLDRLAAFGVDRAGFERLAIVRDSDVEFGFPGVTITGRDPLGRPLDIINAAVTMDYTDVPREINVLGALTLDFLAPPQPGESFAFPNLFGSGEVTLLNQTGFGLFLHETNDFLGRLNTDTRSFAIGQNSATRQAGLVGSTRINAGVHFTNAPFAEIRFAEVNNTQFFGAPAIQIDGAGYFEVADNDFDPATRSFEFRSDRGYLWHRGTTVTTPSEAHGVFSRGANDLEFTRQAVVETFGISADAVRVENVIPSGPGVTLVDPGEGTPGSETFTVDLEGRLIARGTNSHGLRVIGDGLILTGRRFERPQPDETFNIVTLGGGHGIWITGDRVTSRNLGLSVFAGWGGAVLDGQRVVPGGASFIALTDPIDALRLDGQADLTFGTRDLDFDDVALIAPFGLAIRGDDAVQNIFIEEGEVFGGEVHTVDGVSRTLAVDLGGGDDTFRVGNFLVTNGDIDAGAGDDTLIFRSGSNAPLTRIAINLDQYLNFERTIIDGGYIFFGDLAGDIAVNSGVSSLNGSITGDITVAEGAVLGGNPEVEGDVEVDGGVSPGNSIGQITVSGDFRLSSSAELVIESLPDGQVDRVAVTGVVDINGASFVAEALVSSTFYSVRTRFDDVLTAGGGITGAFGALTSPEGFNAFLSQSQTAVDLTLVRDIDFSEYGLTPNQHNAGAALSILLGPDMSEDAVQALDGVVFQDTAGRSAALDDLSGSVLADTGRLRTRSAQTALDGAFGALRAEDGAYVTPVGVLGQIATDGNGRGLDYDTAGLTASYIASRDAHRLGASVSIFRTDADIAAADLNLTTTALTGFTEHRLGRFTAQGVVGVAASDTTSVRGLALATGGRLARNDDTPISGFAGARLATQTQSDWLTLFPSVRLDVVYTDALQVNETGAGAVGLSGDVKERLFAEVRTELGVGVSNLVWEGLDARLDFGVSHRLTGARPSADLRFEESMQARFNPRSAVIDGTSGLFGIELSRQMQRGLSLGIRYDAHLSDDETRQSARLDLRATF